MVKAPAGQLETRIRSLAELKPFKSLLNIYYIDKTGLIKLFFSSNQGIVLTAPRRFAKSTLIDMGRAFSEMEVDENGKPKTANKTKSYQIFSAKIHGKLLHIFEDNPECFHLHFGKYPVLFFVLKDINCESYETMINSLTYHVADVFRRHSYLLKSEKIEDFDKEMLKKYLMGKIHNNSELQDAPKFFTELLHSHFQEEVIVLIDEYDAFAQSYLQHSGDDIDDSLRYISEFISSLLKSSPSVSRALLMACSTSLHQLFLQQPNNLEHAEFLQNTRLKSINYSVYFGFTQKEVDVLLQRFNKTHESEKVKECYDGYTNTKQLGKQLGNSNMFSYRNQPNIVS